MHYGRSCFNIYDNFRLLAALQLVWIDLWILAWVLSVYTFFCPVDETTNSGNTFKVSEREHSIETENVKAI